MSTLAIDPTVLGALIGVAAVVIGAIVTTLLGGKVAVTTAREMAKIQKKDHRDSRFWELRREGYGVVLYNLCEASKYADWLDNGYNKGHGGGPMPSTPVSDVRNTKRRPQRHGPNASRCSRRVI